MKTSLPRLIFFLCLLTLASCGNTDSDAQKPGANQNPKKDDRIYSDIPLVPNPKVIDKALQVKFDQAKKHWENFTLTGESSFKTAAIDELKAILRDHPNSPLALEAKTLLANWEKQNP